MGRERGGKKGRGYSVSVHSTQADIRTATRTGKQLTEGSKQTIERAAGCEEPGAE